MKAELEIGNKIRRSKDLRGWATTPKNICAGASWKARRVLNCLFRKLSNFYIKQLKPKIDASCD